MDRSVIAASTDDADAGPSAWHRLGYFVRRFPLIAAGMAFTVGSLGAGLVYFKKGNRAMSQQMMRYRIGGQAFTFLAIAFYAMPASIATETAMTDATNES
ncbi:HIG1 domain-containing protein [Plasmodiophora brassicae]|uniref:HIG1 domain-containing protein n=1 Tax=Plasmodiophora brassicae TaxID=37360 RepID=A0A0G4IRQ9_PLABS|nr:hypothetical protein PBRA_005895 [Plasmodiophora brassicae]SPQ98329.1 unnamed protein product [Plasmodiophora brassicae]